jgi:phage-related protein (TIGR01555 family)
MSDEVKKPIETTDKASRVEDGFQNFAAKLGVGPGRGYGTSEQNLLSKGHYEFNLLTRNRVQLEAAYRGSWIVGQVIDTIAEDMTRAGIDITTDEDAETVHDFQVYLKKLQTWQSITNTVRWGRLYGGAIAVMQIEGQDLAKPLNPETVGKGQYKGLIVYDRWQLYPVLSELINSGPNLGLPAFYDIVLGSNLNDPGQEPGGQRTDNPNARVRVHYSRCIRMEGLHLPFWQAITEMMWGESVLERMWDRLIAYDTASLSTGNLVNRAQMRSVKIKGYRELIAAGGKAQEALVASIAFMAQYQNNEGITILDGEDEFGNDTYTFAGLADVLIQFGQQVSGSSQIPLVRLFGQSPTGLNSNGESDIRQYYDSVLQKQEYTLRDPLEVLIRVAWQSFTGRPAPQDLAFEFTPLWQMSALDKANVAKINADTIMEVQSAGVIDSATAMRELKQASGDHGLFTHISDEAIEEAENMEPPGMEELGASVQTTGDPGEGPATPEETMKAHGSQKAADNAWKRFKTWFARDEQNRKDNGQFGTGTHTETHKGHEIKTVHTEKGHKLHINGEEQEGTFAGHATATQRGKTIVNKKVKDAPKKKFSYVTDPGIPGTMKEFYKGTLKSSSGKKVTSKKQALAIGYSEEGKDAKAKDARSAIADWVKING